VLAVTPAADVENTLVYTGSEIDGFQVDVLDPDEGLEQRAETAATADNEFVRYSVPTSGGSGAVAVEASRVEAEFISQPAKEIAKEALKQTTLTGINQVEDGCGVETFDCAISILGQISGCLKCAPACTAGMGVSGGVICFLCVFGICSWLLTGYDILRAVNGAVSPTAHLGPGGPTPTGARFHRVGVLRFVLSA